MGLTLLAGPANAGKVELLLDRYLARTRPGPVLIVPKRPDVDWAERELLRRLRRCSGGSITTFDGIFDRIAAGDPDTRPVAADVQQTLALRGAVARTALNGLGESRVPRVSRTPCGKRSPRGGRARCTGGARGPALSALPLVSPGARRAWALGPAPAPCGRGREARVGPRVVGRTTRVRLRVRGSDRDGVVADPALAAARRSRCHCRTSPAGPLSSGSDRPRRSLRDWRRVPDRARPAVRRGGPSGARFPRARPLRRPRRRAADARRRDQVPRGCRHEGRTRAGRRGDPAAAARRDSARPDRRRHPLLRPLACAARDGVLDARHPLCDRMADPAPADAVRPALLALLRFAWSGADRPELFRHLRSPYSGLRRGSVDFVEGRLRGRAISGQERVEEEVEALREARLPMLDALRAADSPVEAVRELAASMLRAAYDLEHPPVDASSRDDLRAYEGCRRVLHDLEGWEQIAAPVSREDVLAALERAPVREPGANEAGRVPVLDLSRARTSRFEHLLCSGWRREPCLGAAMRRLLDDAERRRVGDRLRRGDSVARDRYLFYTACTRPTERLYLFAKPPGRGKPEGGEPVLGGGRSALSGRGSGAVDLPPPALRSHLGARSRAHRARTSPGGRGPLGRRVAQGRRRGPRQCERLGAEARSGAPCLHTPDAPHAPARPQRARREGRSSRHRAERFADCSVGLVLRPGSSIPDYRPVGRRKRGGRSRTRRSSVLRGPPEESRSTRRAEKVGTPASSCARA